MNAATVKSEEFAPDEAAAVRGEIRQARRRAEVRADENAILDTVVLMVTNVLRQQGSALLAPVVARFQMPRATARVSRSRCA